MGDGREQGGLWSIQLHKIIKWAINVCLNGISFILVVSVVGAEVFRAQEFGGESLWCKE